jgi:outer membrane immunogenic protein
MNGPIGGVQAGYNWQNGNYLLGVEADFQGSGQSGTRDFAISFNNGTGVGGTQGTAATSITERMPWLGTVRGRVGYVANQWLVYATGGLAYGRIEVDSSASAGAFLLPLPPVGIGTPTCNGPATTGTCPVWGFSGSGVTKIGWTVGGGAELALGGNWTAKFEYLFVDLGSFDTTFTGLAGCFAAVGATLCGPVAAGIGTIHSTITDNIARVGLNYQFH